MVRETYSRSACDLRNRLADQFDFFFKKMKLRAIGRHTALLEQHDAVRAVGKFFSMADWLRRQSFNAYAFMLLSTKGSLRFHAR